MGSPLFKNLKLHLQNGNTFEIKAPNNTKENVYIHSVLKEEVVYTKNYITYEDIMSGSVFYIEMRPEPNTNLGVEQASKPYSMSEY
jgi:putative alpha-1,2-mannosidase